MKQFTFGIKFKGGDGGFLPLAFASFVPGVVQIGKSGDLRVEIFEGFHTNSWLVGGSINDLGKFCRGDN
ncbi:MAG: hypothetical protein WAS33_24630 [Candidatus Promineifilaceae bacterium]